MRAQGFYWCKNPSGEWEVSMWVPEGEFKQGWRVVRDWEIYQDSYFQEIDERRIGRHTSQIVLKRAFEAGMSAVTYNGRPGYPDAPKFDEWYQKWKDK